MSDNIDAHALRILTKHFDTFISECMDTDGKPKAPSTKALMQARACLPAQYANAFKPKNKDKQ